MYYATCFDADGSLVNEISFSFLGDVLPIIERWLALGYRVVSEYRLVTSAAQDASEGLTP